MENIISKYLNEGYTLIPYLEGYRIRDKFSGNSLTSGELILALNKVFNNHIRIYDICDSWVMKQHSEALKEITIFMNRCTVRLNHVNWEMVHLDVGLINPDIMFKLFQERYSMDFLDWFYDEKMQELVTIKTHQLIGIPPP